MIDPSTSIKDIASRPKPRETGLLSTVIPVSEGENKRPSTSDSTLENAAATSSRKSQRTTFQDAVQTEEYGDFGS